MINQKMINQDDNEDVNGNLSVRDVRDVREGIGGVTLDNMVLQQEELPSLVDLAQEPSSGAWADGWYPATIVEGYATRNGTEWRTEDTLSQKGDSRNLRICLHLKNKSGEERDTFTSFNYRLDDFTPQRIQGIITARKEFASVKGKWPGAMGDLQRSSLAIAKLGAFEKSIGFRLKRTEDGFLNASVFFKQQVDVRLRLNEESGYSEVVEFDKLGARAKNYK